MGGGPPSGGAGNAPTNIRDVVRNGGSEAAQIIAEEPLREMFEKHRPDLKLFAYGCDAITADEFVEVYPMLPGTSICSCGSRAALRTRSARRKETTRRSAGCFSSWASSSATGSSPTCRWARS